MVELKLPRHLAIIMDGNGRWAQARRHNRVYGHIRGARVARAVVEECSRLKIRYLTLFAFSTENWLRPPDEVDFLMNLLQRQLRREQQTLMRHNVRFHCIGDLERLPLHVREVVANCVSMTQDNTGMNLTFALSYGGRQEIAQAGRELVRKARLGLIEEADIDDAVMASHLPSSFLPDPDLLIRTSGESRISNFFLWQAAYSEIIFEPKPWPNFTVQDLQRILETYSSRERRFGRTREQLLQS